MRFQVSFEKDTAIRQLIADGLNKHGLPFEIGGDGHVEIIEPIDQDKLERFRTSLCRYNINIVNDNRETVVERIKHIIHKELQQANGSRTKLSVLISETLDKKYAHLARIFVTMTGYSIESYYIAAKIEHAKQLIAEGELAFKEIAFRLNYNSLGHFSKQFKKHTGLTLSLFKKIVEHKLQHQ